VTALQSGIVPLSTSRLFISDDVAAFVSLFAPAAIGDARRAALKVRERQFRAAFDPGKTVAIAKAIIGKKIRAEGLRREAGQTFLAGLHRAKTADDVRHIKAQAAQEFWRQWAGFEMRFTGDEARRTSMTGDAASAARRTGQR